MPRLPAIHTLLPGLLRIDLPNDTPYEVKTAPGGIQTLADQYTQMAIKALGTCTMSKQGGNQGSRWQVGTLDRLREGPPRRSPKDSPSTATQRPAFRAHGFLGALSVHPTLMQTQEGSGFDWMIPFGPNPSRVAITNCQPPLSPTGKRS